MNKRSVSFFSFFIFLAGMAGAQTNYAEISLPALMKKKQVDPDLLIVDVRTRGEYGDSSRGKSGNIGRIRGAINLTLQDLEKDSSSLKPLEAYRDREVYLICSHSYRSRRASAILLKNGFSHVNNVTGGMTDWYRRYEELLPYRKELDDQDIPYRNLAPVQLLDALEAGKKILLVGIGNQPRFWWDSATVRYYKFFPVLRSTIYFDYADSLKLLEQARKEKLPIVLFNMVNSGAAELADWLTARGVPDASYLVGGLNLLYEVAANQGRTGDLFIWQSGIRFLTPGVYCSRNDKAGLQWIDTRADSLFQRVNQGVKHNYTHLNHAVNFFSGLGADEFEKQFADKKKEYVFINAFGSQGIELAGALVQRGYRISWLTNGYDGWEWYMNNIESFACNELLEP